MLASSRLAVVAVLTGLSLATSTVPAYAGPLATTLTGAAEVPGPGDPDGSGTFTAKVKLGQGTLCYTLTVTDIDPAIAAHVHVGTEAEAGPVVIALVPPTDGTSTACATTSRELLRQITRHPERYYVNVHNAIFPGGAVRGQLG